jgi:hypothetical protein
VCCVSLLLVQYQASVCCALVSLQSLTSASFRMINVVCRSHIAHTCLRPKSSQSSTTLACSAADIDWLIKDTSLSGALMA